MTEQAREPSEDNRMAALQLIARQSVTRLAEILDSKDEAIATARKERDEALRRLKGSMEITEGAQNRRRDEIRANEAHSKRIEELEAQLTEARAEVEKWRKELTLCNKERFDAQTQLAEARAGAERLRMACGMAYGIPGAEKIEVDAMRPVEKMQEIVAAVTAEVERLRTAADAWEATEAWRAVGMHIENRRGRDDAYQAMDRAAARARAVKEKQP